MIEFEPFRNKAEFASSVSALFAHHVPLAERNDVVQRMTDEYFRMFGEYPDPGQLSRLGSFILRETDGEKALRAEGFLSKWQIERRLKRETPLDHATATKCTEHKMYGKRTPKLTSDEVTK